ncbi:MAG: ABC transporter permease [Chloroflexi bacterium]|nr:ABC transporter permease [Chloroflexota bacterium]
MQKFIARRMVVTVFTILLVSLIVFVMVRVSGDPRTLLLDDYASIEDYDELTANLGLDKPLFTQYAIFLRHALVLDFGDSVVDEQPVTATILQRLPATLQLGLAAFIFSLVIGIPLGILSSVKRDSVWDHVGKVVALLGQSLPPFWLGIMLMFFFAVTLDWVPPSGRFEWNSFILPAITLGWFTTAANMRLVRSSMLTALDSEYIKLARAKGVSESVIVWKHALKNAIIPPLTFMGVTLGTLVTGSIVAEAVFAWPGIGLLAFDALRQSDYAMLQGIIIFFTLMYVGTSLAVDILYAYLDPRIRFA